MPELGDLIEIFRLLYQHWAVYVGGGFVVHFVQGEGHKNTHTQYFLAQSQSTSTSHLNKFCFFLSFGFSSQRGVQASVVPAPAVPAPAAEVAAVKGLL